MKLILLTISGDTDEIDLQTVDSCQSHQQSERAMHTNRCRAQAELGLDGRSPSPDGIVCPADQRDGERGQERNDPAQQERIACRHGEQRMRRVG